MHNQSTTLDVAGLHQQPIGIRKKMSRCPAHQEQNAPKKGDELTIGMKVFESVSNK